MGESLMVVVYLLLGLGVVGALYYAVTQITVRQRKLDADMTRLERLAAEVAMNAEAILERVDERIEQLERLSAELEARAAQDAAPVPAAESPASPGKPSQPKPNYAEIRARVYAMADAGHDALDIAQALGIPRGEVQLILNLRGAKMNA